MKAKNKLRKNPNKNRKILNQVKLPSKINNFQKKMSKMKLKRIKMTRNNLQKRLNRSQINNQKNKYHLPVEMNLNKKIYQSNSQLNHDSCQNIMINYMIQIMIELY